MRFYGLSDIQILEMPARRFFTLCSHMDLIFQEENLNMSVCINISKETSKDIIPEYERARAKVIKTKEVDDPKAWGNFMNKMGAQIAK